jgi:hypothetical protein
MIPDRIVTGHAAAGRLRDARRRDGERCVPEHLGACSPKLGECGVEVTTGSDWIRVEAGGSPAAPTFSPRRTRAFPTDLQPPMLSFLCTAPGTSVVEETIFNARFSYVNELARMGADVRVRSTATRRWSRAARPSRARPSKRPTFGPARRSSSRGSPRRARPRSSASSTSIAVTNASRRCSRRSEAKSSAPAASRRARTPRHLRDDGLSEGRSSRAIQRWSRPSGPPVSLVWRRQAFYAYHQHCGPGPPRNGGSALRARCTSWG